MLLKWKLIILQMPNHLYRFFKLLQSAAFNIYANILASPLPPAFFSPMADPPSAEVKGMTKLGDFLVFVSLPFCAF